MKELKHAIAHDIQIIIYYKYLLWQRPCLLP